MPGRYAEYVACICYISIYFTTNYILHNVEKSAILINVAAAAATKKKATMAANGASSSARRHQKLPVDEKQAKVI